MNILLVNPSYFDINAPFAPKIILETKGKSEPLGLLYIASYLKQMIPQINIKIFDSQNFDNDYLLSYKSIINQFKPDVVGISSFTPTIFRTIEIAKITKEINHDVHINIGGPHTSVFPEETLKLKWVDSITIGEGEITFSELVDKLSHNASLKGIKGLWYKNNNGDIIRNPNREYINNLDIIPFPDRQLLQPYAYNLIIDKAVRATTMITSRGCPYNCIFCDTKRKLFIQRSAKNIVDEMEECFKAGYEFINIQDDTFNLVKKNVLTICKEIINRGLKISWGFKGRVDLIDYETACLLKEAGCKRIHIGVESGSDRILDYIKKGFNTAEIKKGVSLLKKVDIQILAYFMIGIPYETKEEIEKTIDFAIELDPDFAQFTVLYPFPGTALYDMAIKVGAFEKDYFREYMQEPFQPPEFRRWKTILSDKEIKKLLRHAYRKFYFRPSYIIKTLSRDWKHMSSLSANFYSALQIIYFILGLE